MPQYKFIGESILLPAPIRKADGGLSPTGRKEIYMGQYYKIINMDKRQQLYPFDFDNGLKLMEWAYDKNTMVLALMNLMADEWKGDRVYVVGDYADTEDMNEVWAEAYRDALSETTARTLYEYGEDFEHIAPSGGQKFYSRFGDDKISEHVADEADLGFRYIYNHATKQVIDLDECPVEWKWQDGEEKGVTKVAPLPLLIAMGNGRGGGDYINEKNERLVGSWCGTVQSVEVSKEPLPECEDYDSFAPNFTENR